MKEKTEEIQGKRYQGIVVGLSSEKTIKVELETRKPHPLYGKILKSHKKYLVHNDPENGIGIADVAVGDLVVIQECKPISKRKNFILVDKVEKK